MLSIGKNEASRIRLEEKCAVRESNPRPTRCKRAATTAELTALFLDIQRFANFLAP